MSSSISNSKPKRLHGIFIVLLALFAFFLFDRGLSALLHLVETGFYASGEDRVIPSTPRGEYDTLIMGTSRTEEGILPIHLHRHLGLNPLSIALVGRFPRFNYFAYLRFRKKNGPPKYLIYGMDYFTFAKRSHRIQMAALGVKTDTGSRKVSPPRGLGRVSLLVRRKPHTDQLLVDLVSRVAGRGKRRPDHRMVRTGISTYKGQQGTVPAMEQQEPPSWEKAPYTHFPGREGLYFEKLLKETHRDKVRVFLVYIPDYINVYRTNHLHESFSSEVRELADRFPGTIFLDFNRPDQFHLDNPDFFVDGRYGSRISHLSAHGAALFNRLLARALRHYLHATPGSRH